MTELTASFIAKQTATNINIIDIRCASKGITQKFIIYMSVSQMYARHSAFITYTVKP